MNRIMSNIAIALVILLPSLTGCAPNSIKWECPKLPNNRFDNSVNSNRSDPKTVKIQIDGTLSMQGFVKVDGSRYVQTLDLLDRAITTTFSNSTVKYYRFGISSEEQKGQQNSQTAQKPDFYSNESKLQDAKLSAAIKTTGGDNNDDLLIIVTDLYQKESSQESPIIKVIKENYIQKGKAVGILAVKSEFKGTIYDVGKQDKNFEWQADRNNVKKNRPFYVILLGKYDHTARYFDKIKGNLPFIEEDKFIIYYPRFLEKPLSLNISDGVKRSLPEGIITRRSINDGQIRIQLKDPNSTDIDILQIRKKIEETKQQEISYAVDYHYLPYTLQVEPTAKPNITEFSRGSNNFQQTNSALIEFSKWKLQDKTLNFVTQLSSIQEVGVYKLVFDIFPSKFIDQVWWEPWSFNEEDAKSWSAEPKNFDGSRTYNLLPFLQSLSEITFQQIESNKSPIGRFCYLFQRE